jgi:hypothetical protein
MVHDLTVVAISCRPFGPLVMKAANSRVLRQSFATLVNRGRYQRSLRMLHCGFGPGKLFGGPKDSGLVR